MSYVWQGFAECAAIHLFDPCIGQRMQLCIYRFTFFSSHKISPLQNEKWDLLYTQCTKVTARVLLQYPAVFFPKARWMERTKSSSHHCRNMINIQRNGMNKAGFVVSLNWIPETIHQSQLCESRPLIQRYVCLAVSFCNFNERKIE